MVSASLVKELRQKTGAGIMDCKEALKAVDGDLSAAVDWLRKKGLSKAAKKAGRSTAEGLVAIRHDDQHAVLLEVNSETDFVARNDKFQQLVTKIADVALKTKTSKDELLQQRYPDGSDTIDQALVNAIATIGENISLSRVAYVSVDQGVVVSYTHNAVAADMGRIVVGVALSSSGDKGELRELGRKLAIHIAASQPLAITKEHLDDEIVAREKSILAEQAKQSGKPEAVIEKMVEGRLSKYLQEVVLVEQTFVVDGETKIADLIARYEDKAGAAVTVSDFKVFVLGQA